jgi:alpha-L-fucosidase
VWKDLEYAAKYRANLLLNTGPRPAGDIDPQDVATLRELGAMIRKQGFPKFA